MSDPASQPYSILFNGELQPGIQRQRALAELAQLTNLTTDDLLDALFSVKPVIINTVESKHLADTYLKAFGSAGLEVISAPWEAAHEDIINVALGFGHYAPRDRIESNPNYVVEFQESDKGASSLDKSGFCLVFTGRLQPGVHKAMAIENICRLTDQSVDRVVEEIFSIIPVVVFRHPELEQAEEYLNVFTDAGLSLDIKESGECDDILAESQLRIRNDKPPPLPGKRLQPFSLLLALCASVGALAWTWVHLYSDGLLKPGAATTIEVELTVNARQTIQKTKQAFAESVLERNAKTSPELSKATHDTHLAPLPNPTQEPVAHEPMTYKTLSEIAVTTPQTPESAVNIGTVEKTPETKPKSVMAPNSQRTEEPAKLTPAMSVSEAQQQSEARQQSEAQQQAEESYYMRLLSWFARPDHQHYDAPTRALNLKGEIELEITIARNGELRDVKVVRSSSQELTEITRATAQRASPYPPVPDAISGKTYRFKLPLKYTLKENESERY